MLSLVPYRFLKFYIVLHCVQCADDLSQHCFNLSIAQEQSIYVWFHVLGEHDDHYTTETV